MNRLGRVKTPTFLLGMGEGTIKRVHKATNEAGTMVRIGGSNLLMYLQFTKDCNAQTRLMVPWYGISPSVVSAITIR